VLEGATDAVEAVDEAVEFVDVVGTTPLLDGADVTVVDGTLVVVVGASVPVTTTVVLGAVLPVSAVKLLATA
jgi:hypothetical protein